MTAAPRRFRGATTFRPRRRELRRNPVRGVDDVGKTGHPDAAAQRRAAAESDPAGRRVRQAGLEAGAWTPAPRRRFSDRPRRCRDGGNAAPAEQRAVRAGLAGAAVRRSGRFANAVAQARPRRSAPVSARPVAAATGIVQARLGGIENMLDRTRPYRQRRSGLRESGPARNSGGSRRLDARTPPPRTSSAPAGLPSAVSLVRQPFGTKRVIWRVDFGHAVRQ